eukprot:XP_011673436.1 PREDICTED: mediator of RNA polymerase II transcription subunit 23 [Strongylocentrotus purpuratus]
MLCSGRSLLLPVIGHSNNTSNSWRLDPVTLAFPTRGLLPFEPETIKPQTGLLRYVLKQPYSRDMICTILALNKGQKQKSVPLEEEIANLLIIAMEKAELQDGNQSNWPMAPWQHLSTQLIIFALFQFVSFPSMVESLRQKLSGRNIRKGRDRLMWVLLQFISGSLKKAPLSDFLPVLSLADLLYPEKKGLPLPDINQSMCTHVFSMACIWNHLDHKKEKEKEKEKSTLQRPPPPAIKTHLEYLQQTYKTQHLPLSDFRIALQLNAYSTVDEMLTRPLQTLVDYIYCTNANSTVPLPGPATCVAVGLTAPIPLSLLDSLTVHAKMSVIHLIVNKILQWHKQNIQPSAGSYIEIESPGTKGFTPSALQSFFEHLNMPTEMRGLKRAIEDEYNRWTSNIIWKMLLVMDTERITPTVVKILELIGPRGLSRHIRTFADYLVCEFSTSAGGQHVNMCVEKLNAMVWKLNIITLDRLVLSLALRSHEGNEAQVGFFIIQLLILKPNEFRTRVSDFVKENSPEHWTQSDWHSKHMAYHRVTLLDKSPFPVFDWRFNEFPNISAHALHCVCVELMALSINPKVVGDALLDVVLKNPSELPRENVMIWINAIALVLTSLPETYCEMIQTRIVEVICREPLAGSKVNPMTPRSNLNHMFAEFSFASAHPLFTEGESAYVIAITHAIWHHSNIGQLTPLPQFLREQVKPHVKTEDQFLFICHIVGPFLQRFHEERTRCLMEIAIELYDMLQSVDRHSQQITHADTICDFFYHMKYMFTGDGVKADAEKVIRGLKPPLRTKMRFISKGVESLAVSSRPAPYSINAL